MGDFGDRLPRRSGVAGTKKQKRECKLSYILKEIASTLVVSFSINVCIHAMHRALLQRSEGHFNDGSFLLQNVAVYTFWLLYYNTNYTFEVMVSSTLATSLEDPFRVFS